MRRAAAIIMLICLPLSAVYGADIYRSIDAQGNVKYSDTPTPGAVLISTVDPQVADSSAASASTANGTGNADTATNDAIHQRLVQEAAARSVQQDTAKARAQECKQAQDAYEQSIDARRLYKLGKDGTREYLNDDQIQQERINNRLAMQAACKSKSTS